VLGVAPDIPQPLDFLIVLVPTRYLFPFRPRYCFTHGAHARRTNWLQLATKRTDRRRALERKKQATIRLSDYFEQASYAILLVFQAMDAAGKDGAIRHVMSGVNPQGCQVFSFRHPSPTELQHDFLWRTTRDLPERGRIGIFNRSYYEEVLIVRVHRDILLSEGLPDAPRNDTALWHDRYRSISNLERHLHANGTRIVKFFLHLSKEEQRKRFLARIDEPDKNWKFSAANVEECKFWKHYMKVYEEPERDEHEHERFLMVCYARRRQRECAIDRVPNCP